MKPVYVFEKDIKLGNYLVGREIEEQNLEGDFFITAKIDKKEADSFNLVTQTILNSFNNSPKSSITSEKDFKELIYNAKMQFVALKTQLNPDFYDINLDNFYEGIIEAKPKGDSAEQINVILNSVKNGDFDIDFTEAKREWENESFDARDTEGELDTELEGFEPFDKVKVYSEGEEIFFEFQKNIDSEVFELFKKTAESMQIKDFPDLSQGQKEDILCRFASQTEEWLRECYEWPTDRVYIFTKELYNILF